MLIGEVMDSCCRCNHIRLHHKLKFMFRYKLVIVHGEKDFVISELSSFQYVETEKGITEVPFEILVSDMRCRR